jgi:membrane-associated phospholipid phosphatase
LIVGAVLVAVCRNWFGKIVWTLWPAWVWFSVMATGNHFWLDVLAGVVVALVALAAVYRHEPSRLWLSPRRAAA